MTIGAQSGFRTSTLSSVTFNYRSLLFKFKPTLRRLSLYSSNNNFLNNKIFPESKHIISTRKIMSWTCTRCTFVNPQSQKSTCEICLSPQLPPPPPQPPLTSPSHSLSLSSQVPHPPISSSSSSSPPKWSCKACTFLNPYNISNCQVCDTRASLSSLSTIDDLNILDPDDDSASSVGSIFYPLRRCSTKIPDPMDLVEKLSPKRKTPDLVDMKHDELGGFRGVKSAKKAVISEKAEAENGLVKMAENAETHKGLRMIKILSYNVWFREDLEMHNRMQAIGELIQLHSPHVICFQEVTPNIYAAFQKSGWWKKYHCSVSHEMAHSAAYFCMQLVSLPVKYFSQTPFSNSIMGRELCIAEIAVEVEKPLVVATTHLESPCPAPPTWDQMFSKERVQQAKEAVNLLGRYKNVIFCGDMNWCDKLDGQFPFLEGWVDAWLKLRPKEVGWTYDTKSNKMLLGNRTLQKRLDRFICHLHDFEISGIEMIGTEAITGLSHCKEKKRKGGIQKLELPVLPSDHYGLLLTITSQ
ncbi:hypothetical protein Nepgr_007136 [Nepenthes gracilis]|uniref:RanBP2-type domain-containing protein n=1 Tax=Nepenthes gracilis TaxID=150966 RepID=A0AAD3XI86_NEPGR|nr:hypothetical protein Nepgr_007136 [Nepenthes gracilis]